MTSTQTQMNEILERAANVNGLPETDWIDVTPELAHELMARNSRNRRIRPMYVQLLKGAMKRGEWRPTAAEPIRIAKNGRLDDGQHRLLALIEANKTFPFLFAFGTAASGMDQEVMDAGRPRSLGDALKLRGEIHSTNLAAALRYSWAYDTHGSMNAGAKGLSTPPQLIRYFNRHPEIRESLEPGRRASLAIAGPGTGFIALHYLFSRSDPELADEFMRLVSTGADMETGHPILALRSGLIKSHAGRTGKRDTTRDCAATIKTWNYWMAGESVRLIHWKGVEGFPQIDGVPPETPQKDA